MNLSQLRPPKGQKQKNQRIGQGMGSGRGKFSGRGAKGAKSISGYSRMRGFEGGQMPLHRRLPKRGFTNIFRKEYAIVNVAALEALEGSSFDPGALLSRTYELPRGPRVRLRLARSERVVKQFHIAGNDKRIADVADELLSPGGFLAMDMFPLRPALGSRLGLSGPAHVTASEYDIVR